MPLIHKYFVLKPRGNTPAARASRTAMRLYASEIETHDKQLANELRDWAYRAEREAHVEGLQLVSND